jgi:hypothetical protein
MIPLLRCYFDIGEPQSSGFCQPDKSMETVDGKIAEEGAFDALTRLGLIKAA